MWCLERMDQLQIDDAPPLDPGSCRNPRLLLALLPCEILYQLFELQRLQRLITCFSCVKMQCLVQRLDVNGVIVVVHLVFEIIDTDEW